MQTCKRGEIGDMREKPQGLKMRYFVLNPTKNNPYGLASRMAIREYAEQIAKANPVLSKDLNDWMDILP